MTSAILWQTLSQVYGFIGNSLLKPMTQTPSVGLDTTFWESFPYFGDTSVKQCVEACGCWASCATRSSGTDPVERAAVEYTRLFIGPPSPAAPPWETLYRGDHVSVGFGEATFEMRRLLREASLELSNENRQYEDHMGIELLYVSEQCRRRAVGEGGGLGDREVRAFIEQHPLRWIGAFRERVVQTCPNGYFDGLLALAQSVLAVHAKALA